MATFTRTTDQNAHVKLPRAFANSRIVIEQISATELRIRKASAAEPRFAEETVTVLSDRDRDLFLALLDKPPRPNAALRRAAAEYARSRQPSKKRRRA